MGIVINGKAADTKMTLTHEPSQAVLTTTPPIDNQGDGTSFSPTDLFAASLAACTSTIMALYAKNHGIPIEQMNCQIEKHMQVAPRRIAKLDLKISVKSNCSTEQWNKLVAAGKACPVRLSLHPDVVINETFERL